MSRVPSVLAGVLVVAIGACAQVASQGTSGGVTGSGGAGGGPSGAAGGFSTISTSTASGPHDAAPCPDDGGTARMDPDPSGDCPAGWISVCEIGGVAGGGGCWCSPVPPRCASTATCACLASCACPGERCYDEDHALSCDNGIR
jgi:hypothetical protein